MYNLYFAKFYYKIRTNIPWLNFLTLFWKFTSSYRIFINLKDGRKHFIFIKKCPWCTKMRFFKDSLSSTYYYFTTVVEETCWENTKWTILLYKKIEYLKKCFLYLLSYKIIDLSGKNQIFVINNSIQLHITSHTFIHSTQIFISLFYTFDTFSCNLWLTFQSSQLYLH